ncbi:MAG: hypothetical protein PWQ67_2592 [Clostridia bacterium]|nr:hypothetical protein [Clostridia bacterium]
MKTSEIDIRYRESWFPLNKLTEEQQAEVLEKFSKLQKPQGSVFVNNKWVPEDELNQEQKELLKNRVSSILSEGICQQIKLIQDRNKADKADVTVA